MPGGRYVSVSVTFCSVLFGFVRFCSVLPGSFKQKTTQPPSPAQFTIFHPRQILFPRPMPHSCFKSHRTPHSRCRPRRPRPLRFRRSRQIPPKEIATPISRYLTFSKSPSRSAHIAFFHRQGSPHIRHRCFLLLPSVVATSTTHPHFSLPNTRRNTSNGPRLSAKIVRKKTLTKTPVCFILAEQCYCDVKEQRQSDLCCGFSDSGSSIPLLRSAQGKRSFGSNRRYPLSFAVH